MTVPIIALAGPIGCGKTTIAQMFMERHPDWVVINFADMVREVVELVYNIPTESQKLGSVKAACHAVLGGHTLRYALQHIGTQGFRHINDHTWTDVWDRKVALAIAEGAAGIIVEDMRFDTEQEAVLDCKHGNGFVVYVERTGPHEKLKACVARHNVWWRKLLRAVHFPCYTLHQSELEIANRLHDADYLLPNLFDITTESGVDETDIQLNAMLSHLGIETPWSQQLVETYRW